MGEDRIDPGTYNLSELQLAQLQGNDIGTRSPSNLEGEIEDTVSNLDARLEYLVEDISRFHSEGYLNEDTWPQGWDELSDLDRDDPLYDPPFAKLGISRNESKYIELAIHLGHISRLLYSNFAPEFDEQKIALGLLIGLSGGYLKKDWMTDSAIQKFLDDLPDEDQQATMFSMPDAVVQDNLQQVLVEIKDSTQEISVTIDWENELRDQLSNSNVTLTSALFSYASEKVDSADQPNVPPVISDIVTDIESIDDIQHAEQLAQYLNKDIDTLMTTEYKGAEADEVFWVVFSTENLQNNTNVATEADSHKQLVGKLLNDMQGREPPWNERPLVKQDIEYMPTEYGKLVGQLLRSDNDDIEYSPPPRDEIICVCHAHVLGQNGDEQEELIRNAMKEADITTEQSA